MRRGLGIEVLDGPSCHNPMQPVAVIEQVAIEFLVVGDEIASGLPKGRAYMAEQLRRASSSISLNIAGVRIRTPTLDRYSVVAPRPTPPRRRVNRAASISYVSKPADMTACTCSSTPGGSPSQSISV